MKEVESEVENYTAIKHLAWISSTEEGNQIQTQKELNFLGFKIQLENIKNKGFQNPKFVIYLIQFCSLMSIPLMLFLYGYATNWDVLAFGPAMVGWTGLLPVIFFEFNQSRESVQTTSQKIMIPVIKLITSFFYSFAIIYVLLFNTPFRNTTIYMAAVYPCFLLQSFIVCLCAKYNNEPKQQTTEINNFRNKNFRPSMSINVERSKQYNASTTFFGITTTVEKIDKWKIYGYRFWEAVVLSAMYIDVLSDVYCGFVLIQTYGNLSAFLRVSGIALIVCCVADLMLVFFMLIFPGRVSHFAHKVAFVMEIPNFVLTGISIWKIRQLIYRNQIQNYEGQQLAVFSVVTTSLSALIHIMYIVDSWAVKSAIEFVQTQHS